MGFSDISSSAGPFWAAVCVSVVATVGWLTAFLRLRSCEAARRRDKFLVDIAEKAPVGLLQVDVRGRIEWANAAELKLLGYSEQDFVGKKVAEFYADPSEAGSVMDRLVRGDTLFDFQTNLRARDGSLRNVLVSSSAEVEKGQLVRARLVTQDNTARWKAEEEIRRLNLELEQRVEQRTAQLEAANKEMESFSYSVSHDLRAPLRALRGFTEVLLEVHASQLDSRGQDFLRRACAASFRMEGLIEDLLKLAQVSRADLQMEQLNLSSLAGDIAAELANSDSTRTVRFVIEPGCSALGDPRLVRLALDNLLRNSWKFSGKRPEARIEFGKLDGGQPAFFVRDNGAGFDMAFSKKLFGVFQRLHPATEFPGTGVGLATVQRIINRHGGRAWAAGEINKGATFYFTLPGMDRDAKNAALTS